MKAIGIICEYNPFHNGHLYHIKQVKEMFPNSVLVLVLNGYFLQRGEISYLSKQDKTILALEAGVDLVVELPVIFGTQSADIFAEKSLEILTQLKVSDVVFGSECNNISKLFFLAKQQLHEDYFQQVQSFLQDGYNYPTALFKALNQDFICQPNDLLGISYAKAVLKNKWKIHLHTIQRTSGYHNLEENDSIISASNIRKKIQLNDDITKFVPPSVVAKIQNISFKLFFQHLRFRILTDPDLSRYMTVDEGIEHRLKKEILNVSSIEDFLRKIKTKRYTYNKINRMFIHLLLGFTKELNSLASLEYIKVLGFNLKGKSYLNFRKKDLTLPFQKKDSKIYQMELIAATLYDELTHSSEYFFDLSNKPVIKNND